MAIIRIVWIAILRVNLLQVRLLKLRATFSVHAHSSNSSHESAVDPPMRSWLDL